MPGGADLNPLNPPATGGTFATTPSHPSSTRRAVVDDRATPRSSTMRKIIATEYLTLDGVMEAPSKWSGQFWNDEAAQFKFEELFASDALLLGRVTYEGFAAAWPNYNDEAGFADRMNGLPKYVVSTTLDTAEWNNSTLIKENIVEEIAKLKQEPGQDILLAGSADLMHTLMEHNLIDEYRLMVHPIVVGSGKRLFREGDNKVLQLVDTRTLSTGIIILTYHPAQSA
jgi:dihydrofolate reductase